MKYVSLKREIYCTGCTNNIKPFNISLPAHVEVTNFLSTKKDRLFSYVFLCNVMTQFQIEGGGVVQGVTKLISTFSAFVT